MEQAILVGTVVLFVAFLLWNGLRAPLRRAVRERLSTPDGADSELEGLLEQLRNGAKTGPILRKIRKRVANESSSVVQAIYLGAAGDVLGGTVSRKGTALRYYIKALKADPACVGARHGLRALLLSQRRGFKLEQLYWQLLSMLDFDVHGCEAVSDAWRELADLLERRRSGRYRAKAIRRMLATIGSAPTCDEDVEPSRDCSED